MKTEEKIKQIIGCKATDTDCHKCVYTVVSTDEKINCKGCRDMIHLKEAVKWKEQQMIEKAVEWFDSIMYYVSEEDKRLVCNFSNFNGLINDFKKYMEE